MKQGLGLKPVPQKLLGALPLRSASANSLTQNNWHVASLSRHWAVLRGAWSCLSSLLPLIRYLCTSTFSSLSNPTSSSSNCFGAIVFTVVMFWCLCEKQRVPNHRSPSVWSSLGIPIPFTHHHSLLSSAEASSFCPNQTSATAKGNCTSSPGLTYFRLNRNLEQLLIYSV